jgi:hypothetical protein
MMRAQGWRGTKAKRSRLGKPVIQELPVEAIQAQIAADIADRQVRNSGRRLGLIIPPSASEARQLREQGTPVGAGGLLLPPT